MIGVVIEFGQIGSIRLKQTGEDRERRQITIADDSNFSVAITMWGALAQLEAKVGSVIALKNCRVSDYQGCSLNSSSDENCAKLNVLHPRGAQLKKWFAQRPLANHLEQIKPLTKSDGINSRDKDGFVTIAEMKTHALANEMMMSGDAPAYFVISGYISVIFCGDETQPRPMFYLACEVCKKKVSDEGNGYRCERCNRLFSNAVPTYQFSLKVQDFTDSQIFNVLGDGGEAILGMNAA